jgi:uncharacterized lipoprotein NlpE involved in copper resistance
MRAARATPLAPGDFGMGGTYAGKLACVDCKAIDTKIVLDDAGPNAGFGHGAYVMTERYIGGPLDGKTATTLGRWSTTHWVKDAGYTGILKLQALAHGALPVAQYFYCDHGRSLRPADQHGKPLPGRKNAILLRVSR